MWMNSGRETGIPSQKKAEDVPEMAGRSGESETSGKVMVVARAVMSVQNVYMPLGYTYVMYLLYGGHNTPTSLSHDRKVEDCILGTPKILGTSKMSLCWNVVGLGASDQRFTMTSVGLRARDFMRLNLHQHVVWCPDVLYCGKKGQRDRS